MMSVQEAEAEAEAGVAVEAEAQKGTEGILTHLIFLSLLLACFGLSAVL